MASRLGSPGEYVDYAASKGAIDSLTIGLAKEVAAEGIRVNAVRPGVIYTEIHASGGEPGRVDRVKSAVPMQRGGQPDEVARAILWLVLRRVFVLDGDVHRRIGRAMMAGYSGQAPRAEARHRQADDRVHG